MVECEVVDVLRLLQQEVPSGPLHARKHDVLRIVLIVFKAVIL